MRDEDYVFVNRILVYPKLRIPNSSPYMLYQLTFFPLLPILFASEPFLEVAQLCESTSSDPTPLRVPY